MLTIPESVKALYKTDGVRKNFRAHFPGGEMADITNSNIVRESLHFTESLCSQNNFRFGLAEASVLEFETVGVGNMYGMTINASIEIDVSSLTAAQIADIEAGTWDGELVDVSESDIGYGFYRVPLGVFRVEKCPRNHGAMTHRKVVAYSADQFDADPNGTIPGMPSALPTFPYYTADVSGVLAASKGEGLTKVSDLELSGVKTQAFWTPGGTQWNVTLRDWADQNSNLMKQAHVAAGTHTSDRVDFIRVGNFDASAYYAQGVAAAAAMDAAHMDFTYGPDGKQLYSSNLEALLDAAPWFFYPVLIFSISEPAGTLNYCVPLSPNTLVGLPIWARSDIAPAIEDRLFKLGGATPDTSSTHWYLVCLDTDGVEDMRISVDMPVPILYHSALPSFEMFRGTATGVSIKVQNSGALPKKSLTKYDSGSGTYKVDTMKMYSYVNTVDYPKLVNGCYELKGQFAKTDRLGGFETVELSPASYLSIGPGDYEDVWWDEYDVDPIGSVVVTVNGSGKTNAQNTPSTISIGSGASVYDMSDNEAMEKLTANTLSDIRTLLRGSFKTNAARVGFTPIEMTMQGWPWMEAGDALRITAEDGTVVNTYALRVEMDGVQKLMSTITAEGGEIVGET